MVRGRGFPKDFAGFAAGAARAALVLAACLAAAPTGAAPVCGTQGLAAPRTLERRSPDYPDGARLAGLEGYVDVELTVLRDGRTGWIRVVRAEPVGLFEAAALDAVRDWRFDPARAAGEPVECRASTRVRFTLTDEIVPGHDDADGPGRPFPAYPEPARAAGIEGYVRVEYAADADGVVRDVTILESVPSGAFDDAVRTALLRWRYAPVEAPRHRVGREFAFRLPGFGDPPAIVPLNARAYPQVRCVDRPRGRVRVLVQVGTDGRMKSPRVVDSDPPRTFDADALRAVQSMRRAPARRQGAPIESPGLLTIDFDPDDECGTEDVVRRTRTTRPPRVGAIGPARDAPVARPPHDGIALHIVPPMR